MSKKAETIRFAVGSPDGPCGSIWRAWVPQGRSDIYIAARGLASSIKISLHESGQWQHSFTKEFYERKLSGKRGPLRTRHRSTWQRPPEIGPGVTLAFRIIVPHSEVTANIHGTIGQRSIVWIPRPAEGSIIEFQVWLTKPRTRVTNWPGYRSRSTQFIGKIALADGETVWVTALEEPIPDLVSREIGRIHDSFKTDEPDIRAILFGNEQDGSRSYIDVDMSRPKG